MPSFQGGLAPANPASDPSEDSSSDQGGLMGGLLPLLPQGTTEKLLNLANNITNPDAKWYAFMSGALSPTHSGGFAEGASNAMGNMSQAMMEEGKLRAQYVPVIYNALMQQQMNMINANMKYKEMQQKSRGELGQALLPALGGMAANGQTAIDPNTFTTILGRARNNVTLPPVVDQIMRQGANAKTDEERYELLRSLVSGAVPPAEGSSLFIGKPGSYEDSYGHYTTNNSPFGSRLLNGFQKGPEYQHPETPLGPGVTSNQSPGFGLAPMDGGGARPFQMPNSLGAGNPRDLLKGLPNPTSAPGEVAPPPQPPIPQPPPPQGGPGAAPPAGAPNQPPKPPMPPPGMPSPQTMGGPGAPPVSSPAGPPQGPVAGGAPSTAPGSPPPGGAGATPPGAGPAGVSSHGSPSGLPELPPLAQPYGHNSITGTPVRSKPGDEYVAAGMKDFQEKKSDMDHTVQASQAFMDNMSQVANVVQRAKFGPWQSVREDLSNLVRNNPILSVIPGGDALGKRWADTIAGGSDTDGQAAVREFEKMSVLAAWQQLKSNVPATSGQRVAMQEFLIQLEKGTTNPNMPPEAIYNLLRQYNRQHQRNVWEANKYNEFASQAGENTDFGQAQNWINKQRESYQINVNGKTYQTGHDMQGRPWIVVPNPQNGKPMRVYDNGQQLP